MDWYGNGSKYSDYRNGGDGSANAASYPNHQSYANYHQHLHPPNARYPHTVTGNVPPSLDRYSGYNAVAYGNNNNNINAGYNSTAYGYNGTQIPIDSRSNPFYAQYQHGNTYDPYSAASPANNNNYASSAHHQRDYHRFESSASYRTRAGGGYMMRDPYQHSYAGIGGEFHGNGAGKTSPSNAAMVTSGLKNGPPHSNHHHLPHHHNSHSYHQPAYGTGFGDYHKHFPMSHNQYMMDASGGSILSTGPFVARDEKNRKSHRDRSLSKLVAMNRRLESQVSMMNECERLGTPFTESYEYCTDYSATPDSTLSAGYNIVDQPNNSVETASPGEMNGIDNPKVNHEYTDFVKETDTKNSIENSTSSKEPVKAKTPKKSNTKTPTTKRRRRKDSKRNDESDKKDGSTIDIVPLPGFQQAFGSTEIGRFSEIFFNLAESPIELNVFESETDLSPLPWETGDSLEGPHFANIAELTPVYADSYGSTDSPTASNNSYYGDVYTPEYS